MGLYCMESLGRRYQEADETYELFKKVLIGYLSLVEDNEKLGNENKLQVSDEHNEYFLALDILYKTAKSIPFDEANSEERLSDSLAFYKATGLIFVKDGKYYIDANKLKEKFLDYESYKEKKKSAVYSKGPRK